MPREDRHKIWIDVFQTRLSLRLGVYLVLVPFVLLNCLFAFRLWQEGPTNPPEQFVRMLRDYLPVGICLLLLFLVMAWDAVRFSHRLIGPLVRFRSTIQDVAKGVPVRPIKLREGDYLLELRDDFNEMLDSLQRRGLPVLKPNDPADEEQSERTPA